MGTTVKPCVPSLAHLKEAHVSKMAHMETIQNFVLLFYTALGQCLHHLAQIPEAELLYNGELRSPKCNFQ